jgi:hypothetical protein
LRDLAVALAIALSAAVADGKPFMSIPPDAKIPPTNMSRTISVFWKRAIAGARLLSSS